MSARRDAGAALVLALLVLLVVTFLGLALTTMSAVTPKLPRSSRNPKSKP